MQESELLYTAFLWMLFFAQAFKYDALQQTRKVLPVVLFTDLFND